MNIKTDDAQKVRRGNWVYGEFDIPHCSECGIEVLPCNISNYCPHCGAKMEESKMEIKTVTQDCEQCKNCKYFDDCHEKRKIACAINLNITQSAVDTAAMPLSQPLAQPLIRDERDYLAEQIKKDLEKQLYCDFMFGA